MLFASRSATPEAGNFGKYAPKFQAEPAENDGEDDDSKPKKEIGARLGLVSPVITRSSARAISGLTSGLK